MRTRIAAIGVNDLHSLYDSAYLRHLASHPGRAAGRRSTNPNAAIAAKRAAALGNPPVFTDYRKMLAPEDAGFRDRFRPPTRHMAADGAPPARRGLSVSHGKAHGRGCRPRSAVWPRRPPSAGAFVAVPLGQRYQPFTTRARQLLADRTVRSELPHVRPPEQADLGALSRVGRALDARPVGGRRRLLARPGAARSRPLPVPDRRGRRSDGAQPELPGAGPSGRGLRVGPAALPRAAFWERSRSATRFPAWAPTANGRSPGVTRSSLSAQGRHAAAHDKADGEETEAGEPAEPIAF